MLGVIYITVCYLNGTRITKENMSNIKITKEDYIQYVENILNKIRSQHIKS